MFNVKYNDEGAIRKSFEIGDSVTLAAGEWAIFNASTGKLEKQSGAYAIGQGKAFPVFGGTARLDAKALNAAVICLGKGYVAETDKFAAVSIKPGDYLTLTDGVIAKAVVAGTVANVTTGALGEQTDRLAIIGVATSSNADGVLEFAVL